MPKTAGNTSSEEKGVEQMEHGLADTLTLDV